MFSSGHQRFGLLLVPAISVLVFLAAFAGEAPATTDGDVVASVVPESGFLPAHRSSYAPMPDTGDSADDFIHGDSLRPWIRNVSPEETRRRCQTCHEVDPGGFVKDSTNILNFRPDMPREQWAAEINLSVKCGSCHQVVEPQAVPYDRWMEVLEHMLYVIKVRGWPVEYTSPEWLDVLHYYVTGSSEFEELPPDPAVSGLPFTPVEIGTREVDAPKIANVNVVDLDRDGKSEVLVADIDRKGVFWMRLADTGWVERKLATAQAPAKTEVFDFNGDKHMDIVVAYLGSMLPTDERVGGASLMINDGTLRFREYPLIDSMGRMADIRPADFDNDGDFDFVIASYGFLTVGEIGWLEQKPHPSGSRDSLHFEYHRLSPKAGAIHTIPTDLNGDSLTDIVALIAQEHEEIIGFINQGNGEFRQHLIYKAFSPVFGSSGIELADMDKDGDLDILYTNGDAVDLPTPMILPYHGVQWLENIGDMEYVYHSILNFYGAYRAVPGDLDNDGDLDIVAVTMVSNFEDSTRMSIVWLENDGAQNYTPHGIGNTPINLITLDLGDLDGDGDLDLVTGAMNVFLMLEHRMHGPTYWSNDGPYGKPKGPKKKSGKKKR